MSGRVGVEQTPDIEAVLAEHASWSAGGGNLECDCGELIRALGASVSLADCEEQRRAHVAQALAPVLAAAVREAEQRALREAADALEPIIWTDPNVAAWLRDRADRITEPVSHEAASQAGWIDKHGDVWREGDDGLMYTPETAPFPREHVERKWGPLRRATDLEPVSHEAATSGEEASKA